MISIRIRNLFPIVSVCLLLSGCGGKKQSEEIIVERDAIEEHHPGVLGMQASTQNGTVEWISDAEYSYSIVRNQDKSLPKVTNHLPKRISRVFCQRFSVTTEFCLA